MNDTTNAVTSNVTTGAAVMTKDGEKLGSVKEVTATCFKVDVPFHKDYWLSCDLIQSQNETAVVLELSSAGVGEHKMDAPELLPEEDPFRTMPMKPIISDEELLAQRAKMERELAEQSRALPNHDPSPTEMRGARAFERIPADHTGFGDLAGEYVPNAPVYEERMAATSSGGSAMSRIMMYAAPIVLGSATVIGAVMLFRRMRRRKTETLPEHARRVVRDGTQELGTLAQGGVKEFGALAQHGAREVGAMTRERAGAVAHAAKPKVKSTAVVAKERTRRLIHDGLSLAAKQFA